jgi:excinuclease ABC subunit B
VIDVYLAYQDHALRIELSDDTLMSINYMDPLTGQYVQQPYQDMAVIYPAKHYVAPEETRQAALAQIKEDLALRLEFLRKNGKQLEAYRLEQRTNYDLEMIQEVGYCKGIENYSRYFDGRNPGDAPHSLMEYFPKDYLLVIDESHITVPQIRGMHNGDRSRKQVLVDYGFRLPSAMDNRPLNFDEFEQRVNQVIYVSATPDEWELEKSDNNVAEILIRPTGIIDPKVTILPTKGQIEDLLGKVKERVAKKERVLITTLTKRMAEEMAEYMTEKGIKVTYLHSDIDTLERTDILDNLRSGKYDVLVGINLLREGLDLPEVSLVAILDADKEGFLRSETSLIQTMGRAARHISGEVVMYADNMTGSMTRAIAEVDRRRAIQVQYNTEHGLEPQKISKPRREKLIDEELEEVLEEQRGKRHGLQDTDYRQLPPNELKKEIKNLEKEMIYEAEILNFEKAAALRDRVRELKKLVN